MKESTTTDPRRRAHDTGGSPVGLRLKQLVLAPGLLMAVVVAVVPDRVVDRAP